MTNHIEQLKLKIKVFRKEGKYEKAATLELILRDEIAKYEGKGEKKWKNHTASTLS